MEKPISRNLYFLENKYYHSMSIMTVLLVGILLSIVYDKMWQSNPYSLLVPLIPLSAIILTILLGNRSYKKYLSNFVKD